MGKTGRGRYVGDWKPHDDDSPGLDGGKGVYIGFVITDISREGQFLRRYRTGSVRYIPAYPQTPGQIRQDSNGITTHI